MTTLRLAAAKCRFLPARSVTDDTSILTLKNWVLEPLTRWEQGEARPGLLADWSHDGTARNWRFRIRPGAIFHDGKPCTAEDVLHYITEICASIDQFGMKWAYARYLAEARFTAVAADILAMDHPTPFADILDIFSEFYICREDAEGRAVLGTGPYRVEALEQDRRAVLRRVAPGAGPDRIEALAMPEAEDRLRALRDGAVDVAMNLERAEHALDFGADLVWGRAMHCQSVMYYLNGFAGLFASPAARLAVNHAVDVQGIIDGLCHGLGQRSASVASPLHLGMRLQPPTPFTYDPEAAKRLLQGCDIPSQLLIRTPTFMPERAREISAKVAQDLVAIGLDCRIEVQEDRPEYAREVGRKQIGDMAIFDSTPHSSFRVLDDKVSSTTKGLWWQGHDDAELEALFAAARQEVGDREAAYGRCMARLRQNPPWLYLFHPEEVFAARPGTPPLSLDAKGVLSIR
ncbi:ABC transporter substrate-binding protein [Roseomonas sp. F4]